jgi:hypothetical protein
VAATDILAELRIGMNMLDLKRIEATLPPHLSERVNRVLEGVASAFANRVRTGRNVEAPEALLADIDAALAALVEIADGATRRTALQATVGLRRALFAGRPAPALIAAGSPSPLAIAAE